MFKPINMLKVKDHNEKYYRKNGILIDYPASVIIAGKSMISGKSNLLTNILLRPQFKFEKTFTDGDNIYIVSPSMKTDAKLQVIKRQLDIPDHNILEEYDEEVLTEVYKQIEENFIEDPNTHSCIIFDDMSFSGSFKKHRFGILAKMMQNMRHINGSIFITTQTYVDISLNLRSNAQVMILFGTSDKIIDTISDENAFGVNKKQFKKMFIEATRRKYSYMVINFQNDLAQRYLNSKWLPIEIPKI